MNQEFQEYSYNLEEANLVNPKTLYFRFYFLVYELYRHLLYGTMMVNVIV